MRTVRREAVHARLHRLARQLIASAYPRDFPLRAGLLPELRLRDAAFAFRIAACLIADSDTARATNFLGSVMVTVLFILYYSTPNPF